MTLKEFLEGIADAIRTVEGSTGDIPAPTYRERILALSGGGGGGGDGSPYVVNVPVNISASVSVTSEKYYTHALYNGVRLPRIPDSVLASYPYVWIRYDGNNGNYNLVFGRQPWYFNGTQLVCTNNTSLPYYNVPIATYATATEWTYSKDGGGTNFGLSGNRSVLWSNHDIPNGSATATDIYFEGTDPVLTD